MAEQQMIIGAILAGGRSSRMGKPKHAVRLHDGRTMIETVAAALRAVDGCEQVVVVGSRAVCNDALPGAVLVEDTRDHAGPLGGIESLLASGVSDIYLVAGCDMPLLTGAVLEPLVGRALLDDRPAMVVYASADRVEPLPCVIRGNALPVARNLLDEGRASMRSLVRAAAAARIELDETGASAGLLRSINTPEQLAVLQSSRARS